MDTAESGPVLAVAALAREFSGLLRHASSVELLNAPVRKASRAVISNSHWLLVANGEGPRCAAEAMRWALDSAAPRAVLSTGYCGALSNELAAGDIFAATEIRDESGAAFASLDPPSPKPARRGPVLSIDRVATTAREKAALQATGAGVVEMEAAAVAGAAREKGLPFYCIRVVSDSASASLPIDFNFFRRGDGSVDTRRVAFHALRRPQSWPGLIRLASDASRASKLLGDYLADCRF
jgi:nucleoside phosphorylase